MGALSRKLVAAIAAAFPFSGCAARAPVLISPQTQDPTLRLDIRYATECAEALRWLTRVSRHISRICNYLNVASKK